MSDAPERTFVQWPHVNGAGLAFSCQSRPPARRTEYIRSDIHAAEISKLQARIEALVEEAERQDKQRADAFARRHMNAPEDPHVYVLCERYGYGAVMDAASRLWARKDSMGAFYIGGCIGIGPRAAIAAAKGE